jgi:hypothetical protein
LVFDDEIVPGTLGRVARRGDQAGSENFFKRFDSEKVKDMSRTARLVGTMTLVGMAIASGSTQTQAAGPFQFNSLTPCRIFDTRDTNQSSPTYVGGIKLVNPGPHKFNIKNKCGVPPGAQAVTLNVTVVSPNVAGDLRMFPSDVAQPVVSTLNYNAGEPALANGAIVPLAAAATQDLSIVLGMAAAAGAGNIHVLVDVTGYFQ